MKCQESSSRDLYSLHSPGKKLMHFLSQSWSCVVCDNYFRLKSHLNLHINNVHKEHKNYKCKYCKEEFSSEEKFRYHRIAVHEGENEIPCKICNKKFIDKRNSAFISPLSSLSVLSLTGTVGIEALRRKTAFYSVATITVKAPDLINRPGLKMSNSVGLW